MFSSALCRHCTHRQTYTFKNNNNKPKISKLNKQPQEQHNINILASSLVCSDSPLGCNWKHRSVRSALTWNFNPNFTGNWFCLSPFHSPLYLSLSLDVSLAPRCRARTGWQHPEHVGNPLHGIFERGACTWRHQANFHGGVVSPQTLSADGGLGQGSALECWCLMWGIGFQCPPPSPCTLKLSQAKGWPPSLRSPGVR